MFVKICGITSENDGLMAVAMGADALGFLFAPSPRRISPTKAAEIARRLPSDVLTVGVFRNEAPRNVIDIMTKTRLRAAQLHGQESPQVTQAIRAELPMVIKAFPATSYELERVGNYGADIVLIDAEQPGTGEVFDWALAERSAGGHRVILAGGLTPENVAAAIGQTQPWGVDVSSGVESAPGRKDPRLVRRFVKAAKSKEHPAREPRDARDDSKAIYDWRAIGGNV